MSELESSDAETVRSRGLQKLFSASAKGVRGSGEGDGESEGHDVEERRYDPWLAAGGWMNTIKEVSNHVLYLHLLPGQRRKVCDATIICHVT